MVAVNAFDTRHKVRVVPQDLSRISDAFLKVWCRHATLLIQFKKKHKQRSQPSWRSTSNFFIHRCRSEEGSATGLRDGNRTRASRTYLYLLVDSSWLSRSVVDHRAWSSSSSNSIVIARIMRWPPCSSSGLCRPT